MDTGFRIPTSPGTPLFPVSPERANRQPLPQFPSLPSDLSGRMLVDPFVSSGSRSTDVQGKVAQFNNLSKEAAQRRKDNEAALRRAVLGREEAETETRKLREGHRALKQQIEEDKARERKVALRLEVKMEENHKLEEDKQRLKEDFQRLKETLAHSKTVYEKELRRARKEAFKSSSQNIKLSEDYKTLKSLYNTAKEEVETQKEKVESKEKEAFSAQYRLIGVEEELETLRCQMKVVEEERNALRTSLKEEELARIAAEGRIPLPVPAVPDEFSSPKKPKSNTSRLGDIDGFDPFTTNLDCKDDELLFLHQEVNRERKYRRGAEELVDFMKLECQLKRCSCRLAEEKGTDYIHDDQFDAMVGRAVSRTTTMEPGRPTTPLVQCIDTDDLYTATPRARSVEVEEPGTVGPLIEFSPIKGSFSAVTLHSREPIDEVPSSSPTPQPPMPPLAGALAPVSLSESPSLFSLSEPGNSSAEPFPEFEADPSTPRQLPPLPPSSQSTTGTSHILSRTITTTVPLADPETPSTQYPCNPAMTKTREEALASIEKWRRGRSRSVVVNGTPRKPLSTPMKRDCSAPVAKSAQRDKQ